MGSYHSRFVHSSKRTMFLICSLMGVVSGSASLRGPTLTGGDGKEVASEITIYHVKDAVARIMNTSAVSVNLHYDDFGDAPLPDPQELFTTASHILHCRDMVDKLGANPEDFLDQLHVKHCSGELNRVLSYAQEHPVD